jgi:hypothetical protein
MNLYIELLTAIMSANTTKEMTIGKEMEIALLVEDVEDWLELTEL